jgi:hypothetical protein
MDGYDPATYGERWADVYDEWHDEPDEVADTVAFLAELAGPAPGPGCLVELGVGTGRLALPLAGRGYDVRGVDASPAMVARLRAKPGGADLPVALGDMADVPVAPAHTGAEPPGQAGTDPPEPSGPPARCAGVFVAFNTFFNLATAADQQRCLERVVAVLDDGGWFVVAAFVPAERGRTGGGSTVGVRSLTADRVVLSADRYDAATQTITGQFIDITEAGIRLRPIHLRYLWPDQLDALAAAAGLDLAERWASWRRERFDGDSDAHISVYRRRPR